MISQRNWIIWPAAMLFLCASAQSNAQPSHRPFLDRYCMGCHSKAAKMGGLSLDPASLPTPTAQPDIWEKIVRKVRTGMMPPPNAQQPPIGERLAMLTAAEASLDAAKLNPGRTESLRRLNRTEYQNAIRDLLSVNIDATALLPAADSPSRRIQSGYCRGQRDRFAGPGASPSLLAAFG